MFGRCRILVLTIICIFLFAGLSYAGISVTEPTSGDTLTSGSVGYIKVTITNPVVHLSKLKLYYTTVDPPKWNLITIRNCNLFFCPTNYPWEVAWVSSLVTTGKIKAVLLGTNGEVVSRGVSAQFAIEPYGGIVPAPKCGNGVEETGEECDDGNINNGDGCSSHCTIEP